jgi:hypothetical protein
MKYKELKHLYYTYPYHKILQADLIYLHSGESILDKYKESIEISRSLSFRILAIIKVVILIFVPLFALNYLTELIPFSFGEDSSKFGLIDFIVYALFAWDGYKTYQAIINYYPAILHNAIRDRITNNLEIKNIAPNG